MTPAPFRLTHLAGPGYWMDETSGVLVRAIYAYLDGEPMTPEQIAAMRAYLRQWINADVWMGANLADLRADIEYLMTRQSIEVWLEEALAAGIDPL